MRRTAIVATKKKIGNSNSTRGIVTAGCLPNKRLRHRFSCHPQGAGDKTEVLMCPFVSSARPRLPRPPSGPCRPQPPHRLLRHRPGIAIGPVDVGVVSAIDRRRQSGPSGTKDLNGPTGERSRGRAPRRAVVPRIAKRGQAGRVFYSRTNVFLLRAGRTKRGEWDTVVSSRTNPCDP